MAERDKSTKTRNNNNNDNNRQQQRSESEREERARSSENRRTESRRKTEQQRNGEAVKIKRGGSDVSDRRPTGIQRSDSRNSDRKTEIKLPSNTATGVQRVRTENRANTESVTNIDRQEQSVNEAVLLGYAVLSDDDLEDAYQRVVESDDRRDRHVESDGRCNDRDSSTTCSSTTTPSRDSSSVLNQSTSR